MTEDVLTTSKSDLKSAILIHLTQADFEQRLGNILQQLYRVIDQHFPERDENLLVIIRDGDSEHRNPFKIWKTI